MNDEPIPLEDEIYEEEIEVEEETSVTMAMWGEITGDIDNQTDLKEALDAKQDNLTQAQLDAVNSGINSTKVETYDGYQAQINTKASQSALDAEAEARRQADSTLQGNIDAEETARKASDKDIQDVLDGETLARQNADTALGGRIDTEIHDRQVADIGLQGQIDAITSKSDVVDVVATYADLQAYDTQHLGDNDVIKVLDDETHGDALTYYRWSKTNQTWTFIGQEAPYYSKSQTDTLLLGKQNTIDSSHKLSADLVDDTSTTNKFVTSSDITNWNGKQDALTAGTGIDITGGIISTPAIVPEVVAELPTTGEEGKLYLTPKNYTTGTASGNPITATITDEAGQIESFQLDGDAFQQSYTGKNLAQPLDKYAYSLNVGATIESQSDGTVVFKTSSSSTSSGLFIYKTTGNNATLCPELFTAGYTVSFDVMATDTCSFEFGVTGNHTTSTISTTKQRVSAATATGAGMVFYNNSLNGATITISNIQVEAGSTSTSFEPYVGGQPSPNPSYPQDINVVTGTQTISINGTNYPISLGSLELCKIGTYKDYIYKDGSDWKVHKETKSVTLDENDDWSKREYGTNAYFVLRPDISVAQSKICIASQYFRGVSYDDRTNNQSNIIFADSTASMSVNTRGITIRNTPWSDLPSFLSWISGKAIECLYVLLGTTDTTITDQTLIAQLEAIRTASLENGTNTITNTATGTNLAGDMEFDYYGYNPTNRYDKFIWLDLNNNYEQIGGE